MTHKNSNKNLFKKKTKSENDDFEMIFKWSLKFKPSEQVTYKGMPKRINGIKKNANPFLAIYSFLLNSIIARSRACIVYVDIIDMGIGILSIKYVLYIVCVYVSFTNEFCIVRVKMAELAFFIF